MSALLRVSPLILLLLPIEAYSVTLPISASQDNSLYQDTAGSLSNGTGPTFFTGTTNSGAIRRGLIEFDLSGIPVGSTIESVTLDLFLVQAQSFPTEVGLYEVLAEWGEGSSSAGNRGGGGANATTNDATWRHTFFNGALWRDPGGDFARAPSALREVGGEGATYRWLSTPSLIADVQAWLDEPSSNHGWLLQGDESQNGTAKAFATREYSVAANRPLLTVNYSPVPEPSAFGAVMAGIAILIGFRRHT